MDINRALRELYAEKQRLDTTIAALEQHLAGLSATPARVRRGRKKMSPEERLEVSKRMAKYWEARRASSGEAQTPPPDGEAAVTNLG